MQVAALPAYFWFVRSPSSLRSEEAVGDYLRCAPVIPAGGNDVTKCRLLRSLLIFGLCARLQAYGLRPLGLPPLRSGDPSGGNDVTKCRLLRSLLIFGLCARLQAYGLGSLPNQKCPASLGHFVSGERGIRTLGTVASTPAFQAGSFDHSDISPYKLQKYIFYWLTKMPKYSPGHFLYSDEL